MASELARRPLDVFAVHSDAKERAHIVTSGWSLNKFATFESCRIAIVLHAVECGDTRPSSLMLLKGGGNA